MWGCGHLDDDLVGPDPAQFLAYGAFPRPGVVFERVELGLKLYHLAGEPVVFFKLGVQLCRKPAVARQSVGPKYHNRDANQSANE